MINTPAGFGKAINFGVVAGFPVWRAGEPDMFPNALGLHNLLQLESTPEPVYGQPFITGYAQISPTLSFQSVISPFISRRTEIDEDA